MSQKDNCTSLDFPRKDQDIFFVLDTSGSMSGYRINDLNGAMESVISDLALYGCEDDGIDLKIAVLEYNSICRWLTPGPVSVKDMSWEDLKASGLTAFGAALKELDYQLSRERMLQSATGIRPPIVVFVTDGSPADEWEEPLCRLWQNCWYQDAVKIAVAIGESADTEILTKVVGSNEHVFSVHDTDSILHALDEICFLMMRMVYPIPLVEMERDHENLIWDDSLISQSPEQATDEYNRKKCKLLKSIRKLFADANGIPCEITECLEEGQCTGTCSRCDEEIETLSQLLTNCVEQGKPVALPSGDTDLLDDYLPCKYIIEYRCGIWGDW